MKRLAHQKMATLCALIGASISCLSGALAEDGGLADPGTSAVADAASGSGPNRLSAVAASSSAGCALPALAEALGVSEYVAVCSEDDIAQLQLASAALPTFRSDAQAVDDEHLEKLFQSLLESKTAPPLPQQDEPRLASAIVPKQEMHKRLPVQLSSTPSRSLDQIPAIDLQSAMVDTQAASLTREQAVSAGPSASAVSEPAQALPLVKPEMQPVRTVVDKQASSAQKPDDKWRVAVSDTNLDQMRGGFNTGSGLLVSFGIQRAVYINGNMVTTTSFNIPDVGKVSGAQAATLSAAAGAVNLVQNGPGNTIEPGALSQAVGATVIQNTLSNQNIQNLTIIDASTNSLGLLKSINALSTLNDALSNAVGIR
ncbi:MAG: hypothetical protein ABI656_00515 [bacterium]